MKKLVAMAAIAFVAFASQAGIVQWSITKVTDSADKSAAAGWAVAIIDATETFDYAKYVKGDIVATYTGATVVNTTTGAIRASDSNADTVTPNQVYSYYAVVFDAADAKDAKSYIVSDVVTKTANASGSNILLTYGQMGATSGAFAGKSWQTVPEPTSGLLLLIGMAGLALRRRRA